MTPIYHITHVANLRSIVSLGGLRCDNERIRTDLESVGIAYDHIKERRARKRVTLGKQGTLADYVPFYFAPRSPMLYAIHKGAVKGYSGDQRSVVHLRADAEAVAEAGHSYVFTDGHADMAPLSRFFDDLDDLRAIDWAVMRGRYWNDTIDHPDRTRRRQAEFLVHGLLPWSLIVEIGVATANIRDEVNAILSSATHRPVVRVHPEWYY